MQKGAILFCMIFSAIIVNFGMINVNWHNFLPIKANYNNLSEASKKQITCLADNIYFEAAHEPEEGKKAVAFVTLNRVRSGKYPNDICSVVYQKTGGTCQFSWYCENKQLTIKDKRLYNDIRELAMHIVINHEKIGDNTKGSTFYHADYVNPGWKNLDKVDKIGRHIFYKRKGEENDGKNY